MKLLKMWAKGEPVLFILVLTFALIAGCEKGNSTSAPAPDSKTSEFTDIESEVYTVVGRVKSITPDRDFVMVQHDAIEGFMDAMTMPFAVADTQVITGLAAGDSVRFEIRLAGGDATITSLEVQR